MSWFSYFRSTTPTNDNEESNHAFTPSDTLSDSMAELTEDQRIRIQEVLERAERSKNQARIVIDSSQLRNINDWRNTSGPGSSTGDDNEQEEDFLEMEALPENIEVCIGQGSSREVSPFPTSDISMEDISMGTRSRNSSFCTDVLTEKEVKSVEEEKPVVDQTLVYKGMKLLSQKIVDWVKSLDEEDDYSIRKPSNLETTLELEELFYNDSILDDYVSNFSRCICILAVAEAMDRYKLSEEKVIDDYADQCTSNIMSESYNNIYSNLPDETSTSRILEKTSSSVEESDAIYDQTITSISEFVNQIFFNIFDEFMLQDELQSQQLYHVLANNNKSETETGYECSESGSIDNSLSEEDDSIKEQKTTISEKTKQNILSEEDQPITSNDFGLTNIATIKQLSVEKVGEALIDLAPKHSIQHLPEQYVEQLNEFVTEYLPEQIVEKVPSMSVDEEELDTVESGNLVETCSTSEVIQQPSELLQDKKDQRSLERTASSATSGADDDKESEGSHHSVKDALDDDKRLKEETNLERTASSATSGADEDVLSIEDVEANKLDYLNGIEELQDKSSSVSILQEIEYNDDLSVEEREHIKEVQQRAEENFEELQLGTSSFLPSLTPPPSGAHLDILDEPLTEVENESIYFVERLSEGDLRLEVVDDEDVMELIEESVVESSERTLSSATSGADEQQVISESSGDDRNKTEIKIEEFKQVKPEELDHITGIQQLSLEPVHDEVIDDLAQEVVDEVLEKTLSSATSGADDVSLEELPDEEEELKVTELPAIPEVKVTAAVTRSNSSATSCADSSSECSMESGNSYEEENVSSAESEVNDIFIPVPNQLVTEAVNEVDDTVESDMAQMSVQLNNEFNDVCNATTSGEMKITSDVVEEVILPSSPNRVTKLTEEELEQIEKIQQMAKDFTFFPSYQPPRDLLKEIMEEDEEEKVLDVKVLPMEELPEPSSVLLVTTSKKPPPLPPLSKSPKLNVNIVDLNIPDINVIPVTPTRPAPLMVQQAYNEERHHDTFYFHKTEEEYATISEPEVARDLPAQPLSSETDLIEKVLSFEHSVSSATSGADLESGTISDDSFEKIEMPLEEENMTIQLNDGSLINKPREITVKDERTELSFTQRSLERTASSATSGADDENSSVASSERDLPEDEWLNNQEEATSVISIADAHQEKVVPPLPPPPQLPKLKLLQENVMTKKADQEEPLDQTTSANIIVNEDDNVSEASSDRDLPEDNWLIASEVVEGTSSPILSERTASSATSGADENHINESFEDSDLPQVASVKRAPPLPPPPSLMKEQFTVTKNEFEENPEIASPAEVTASSATSGADDDNSSIGSSDRDLPEDQWLGTANLNEELNLDQKVNEVERASSSATSGADEKNVLKAISNTKVIEDDWPSTSSKRDEEQEQEITSKQPEIGEIPEESEAGISAPTAHLTFQIDKSMENSSSTSSADSIDELSAEEDLVEESNLDYEESKTIKQAPPLPPPPIILQTKVEEIVEDLTCVKHLAEEITVSTLKEAMADYIQFEVSEERDFLFCVQHFAEKLTLEVFPEAYTVYTQLKTTELFDNITCIKQLAEEVSSIIVQESYAEYLEMEKPSLTRMESLERTASTATSGADDQSEASAVDAELYDREYFQTTEDKTKTLAALSSEENKDALTSSDLQHIVRVQEFAEELTTIPESILEEAISVEVLESPKSEVSSTMSGADYEELSAFKSFERNELELKPEKQFVSSMAPPLPPPPAIVQERLTQEELEHIARIQKLAEESNMIETNMQDDLSKLIPVEQPLSQEELSAAELEHIARIQQVAEDDQNIFTPQLYQQNMTIDASLAKSTESVSSATSGADNVKELNIFKPVDELTREELEQISRVQKLTEEQFELRPQRPVSQVAPPLPPPPKVTHKLTSEELEHIARVQKMSEETAVITATPVDIRDEELKTVSLLERTESSSTSGADDHSEDLMGSEEHIEEVMVVSEIEHQEQEVESQQLQLSVVSEELSVEELEHISRIQKMAQEMSMVAPTEISNEATLEFVPSMERTESSATSGADDNSEDFVGLEEHEQIITLPEIEPQQHQVNSQQLQPHFGSEELSAAELEHIAQIQKMAEEEFNSINLHIQEEQTPAISIERTVSSATSEADEDGADLSSEDLFEETNQSKESNEKEPNSVILPQEQQQVQLKKMICESYWSSKYDIDVLPSSSVQYIQHQIPETVEFLSSFQHFGEIFTMSTVSEAMAEYIQYYTTEDHDEIECILHYADQLTLNVIPEAFTRYLQRQVTDEIDTLTSITSFASQLIQHVIPEAYVEYIQRQAVEEIEVTRCIQHYAETFVSSIVQESVSEYIQISGEQKETIKEDIESPLSSLTSGVDEDVVSEASSDRNLPEDEWMHQEEEVEIEYPSSADKDSEASSDRELLEEQWLMAKPELEIKELVKLPSPEFEEHSISLATSGADELSDAVIVDKEEITKEERDSMLEPEHIERIQEAEIDRQSTTLPYTVQQELTQEELDHIAQIQALADLDNQVISAPRLPPPPKISEAAKKVSEEVEQEDVSHTMERTASTVTSSADSDLAFEEVSPDEEEQEPLNKLPKVPEVYDVRDKVSSPMNSMERTASSATSGADDISPMKEDSFDKEFGIENEDYMTAPPLSLHSVDAQVELTEEEREHIARIERMAQEMATFSEETPRMALPLPPPVPIVEEIMVEELEHIARIERMAEELAATSVETKERQKTATPLPPPPVHQQEELTAEELEHIAMIERIAQGMVATSEETREITKMAPPLPPPPVHQQEELTTEEFEHIAQIQQRAQELLPSPVKEQESHIVDVIAREMSETRTLSELVAEQTQFIQISTSDYNDVCHTPTVSVLSNPTVQWLPEEPIPIQFNEPDSYVVDEIEVNVINSENHVIFEASRAKFHQIELLDDIFVDYNLTTVIDSVFVLPSLPEVAVFTPIQMTEQVVTDSSLPYTNESYEVAINTPIQPENIFHDKSKRLSSQPSELSLSSAASGADKDEDSIITENLSEEITRTTKAAPPPLPPQPKVMKEVLTNEELEHIAQIQQRAEEVSMESKKTEEQIEENPITSNISYRKENINLSFDNEKSAERTASSATSGADFEKEEDIVTPESIKEDGTKEISTIENPEVTTVQPQLNELAFTQEELDHIAMVSQLADALFNQEPFNASQQVQSELTKEEIDHISRIQQLAEEESLHVFSEDMQPFVEEAESIRSLERTASSATSGADQESEASLAIGGISFEEDTLLPDVASEELVSTKAPPPIPARPAIVQNSISEKLDRLSDISHMAIEYDALTHDAHYPEEMEFEEPKRQMSLDRRSSSAGSNQIEYKQSTVIRGDSFEEESLLQEEEEEPKYASEPFQKLVSTSHVLTAEELEHIARIQKMAEEQFDYISPTKIQESSKMLLHRSSSSVTSGADEFSEKDTKTEGNSFEVNIDVPEEQEREEHLEFVQEPVLVQEELTAEELEHIARIERMAQESMTVQPNVQAPFVPTEKVETEEEKLQIVPQHLPLTEEPQEKSKNESEEKTESPISSERTLSSATSGADDDFEGKQESFDLQSHEQLLGETIPPLSIHNFNEDFEIMTTEYYWSTKYLLTSLPESSASYIQRPVKEENMRIPYVRHFATEENILRTTEVSADFIQQKTTEEMEHTVTVKHIVEASDINKAKEFKTDFIQQTITEELKHTVTVEHLTEIGEVEESEKLNAAFIQRKTSEEIEVIDNVHHLTDTFPVARPNESFAEYRHHESEPDIETQTYITRMPSIVTEELPEEAKISVESDRFPLADIHQSIISYQPEVEVKHVGEQVQMVASLEKSWSSATSEADNEEVEDQKEENLIEEVIEEQSSLPEIKEHAAEELTQEELDHFDQVKRKADETLHKVLSSESAAEWTETEQNYTAESFERTASSATSGADDVSEAIRISFEDATPIPNVQDELTKEELDHIARIELMAEQQQNFGIDQNVSILLADETKLPEKGIAPAFEVSTVTTRQNPFIKDFDRLKTLDKKEPIDPSMTTTELTDEELEHIARIERMAQELNLVSSLEEPKPEPTVIEKVVPIPAPLSSALPIELTAEELEHISRINLMAEQLEGVSSQQEVVYGNTQEELTTEELEHIATIQLMAEELSLPVATKEDSELIVDQICVYRLQSEPCLLAEKKETVHIEIPFLEVLTDEELEHINKVKSITTDLENLWEPTIPVQEPSFERFASSATSEADALIESFEEFDNLSEKQNLTPNEKEEVMEENANGLTKEELKHIAKIQQLAEEMTTSTAIDLTYQPKEKDKVEYYIEKSTEPEEHFTEEELQHFARMQQIADVEYRHESHYSASGFLRGPEKDYFVEDLSEDIDVDLPGPLSEPGRSLLRSVSSITSAADEEQRSISEEVNPTEKKEPKKSMERTSSSATSGADSEEGEVEIYASSFEEQQLLPKDVAAEFTAEELAHIAKVQEMADKDSQLQQVLLGQKLEQQLEPPTSKSFERTASSATSGADSEAGAVDIYVNSFEDQQLLSADEQEELEQPTVTQPPLASIEEGTVEVIIPDMQLRQEEEIPKKFERSSSSETSEADNKEYSIEAESVATEDFEATLTTERVKTFERTTSSATSGADEEHEELDDGDSMRNSYELQLQHEPTVIPQELTAEELEHIARIQKMSEELLAQPPVSTVLPTLSTEIAKSPSLERTTSSATSGADNETLVESIESPDEVVTPTPLAQKLPLEQELTQEELDHIAYIDRMAQELNATMMNMPEPKETAQKSYLTQEELDHIAHIEEIAQRDSLPLTPKLSQTTTVSYTNTFRRSLPHEVTSSTSLSTETTDKKRDLAGTKSSSVHVIYTDKRLSMDSTNDPDVVHEIPKVLVNSENLNAFEQCEHESMLSDRNSLTNVDFMVKLNFMVERVTEDIADAAAEDLSRLIRLKENPRARYFEEGYLLELLDSGSHTSSASSSSKHSPTREEALGYAVEPVVEEPERLGFDLFSIFRRKSFSDRPVSAMAVIQQRQPSPSPDRRKSNEIRPTDIMDLVHRASIGSDTKSDMNIPETALTGLSQEERDHIMQVMVSANPQTTPQTSRRSSSAMYNIPDMNSLNDDERKHIESVIHKAERRSSPFVVSSPNRLSRQSSAASDSEKAAPETINEELKELTVEELAHIAEVEKMIEAFQAENVATPIESKPITKEEPKSSKGFSLGGFRSALSKRTNQLNSLVNSNLASNLISNITPSSETIPVISRKSSETKTVSEEAMSKSPVEVSDTVVTDVDVIDQSQIGPFDVKVFNEETSVPLQQQVKDFTVKDKTITITTSSEEVDYEPLEAEDLFYGDYIEKPYQTSSDSGTGRSSSYDYDDENGMLNDDNIAWLQQNIDVMNNTLKSYENGEFTDQFGLSLPPAITGREGSEENQETRQGNVTSDEMSARIDLAGGEDALDEQHLPILSAIPKPCLEKAKARDQKEESVPSGHAPASSSASPPSFEDIGQERSWSPVSSALVSQKSGVSPPHSDSSVGSPSKKALANVDNDWSEALSAQPGRQSPRLVSSPCSISDSPALPLPCPLSIDEHKQEGTPATPSTSTSSLKAHEQTTTKPASSPLEDFSVTKMFSSDRSKSSGGGFGGFGGLGKFASGALKGAKQATEQISAKAAQASQIAQHAVSTGDLTQVGTLGNTLLEKTSDKFHSATNLASSAKSEPPTPAMPPMNLPPGLEYLPEEEQMKIMAVMACAEIDANQEVAPPAKITKPVEAIKAISPSHKEPVKPVQTVKKQTTAPTPLQPARSEPLPPGVDEELLKGLSPAEQEQIIAVMRMAAMDSEAMPPPASSSQPAFTSEKPKMVTSVSQPIPSPEVEQKLVKSTSIVESGYITAPSTSHSTDSNMYSPELYAQEFTVPSPREIIDTSQYGVETFDEEDSFNLLPSEHIIVTESSKSPAEVDAVEADEDFWIQPKHEYKVPETWEPHKTGRMWTTVFSDDGDIAASEYDGGEVSIIESEDQGVEQQQQDLVQQPIQERVVKSSIDHNRHDHLFDLGDGSFELEMEDPLSPTVIVSTVASNKVSDAKAGFSKMIEIPRTPQIKITQHEDEKNSDEDSDAETPPSSDEDDYPDQVIEVPSVSIAQMEQEEQTQVDNTREVLRQIQSFGEAADDEFDVQWAASLAKKEEQTLKKVAPEKVAKPEKPEEKKQLQRINPFIDSPDDDVTVEQVNLEEDDLDYQQAINYYTMGDIYKHRPGPVYTIPEGEEDLSNVSSESKYKAQMLERKPLHGNVVPNLVPQDAKKKSKKDVHKTLPYSRSPEMQKAKPEQSKPEITPVRTAPPPPDASTEGPTFNPQSGDVTVASQPQPLKKGQPHFTTDIHQAEDVHLPPHIHIHGTQPQIKVSLPASVSTSDAAFLAQTFDNGVVVNVKATTLGSQLPSADHAVYEVEDSQSSKLKRSPAMILSNEPPRRSVAELAKSREDALLQSANSEMGRRKLPSLPSNRAIIGSSAVPTYYSSSAPEQNDVACNGSLPSTSTASVSFSNIYFDPTTSSSTRLTSTAAYLDGPSKSHDYLPSTSSYNVDPAILPGATFKSLQRIQPRTAYTAVEHEKRSASVPKMSEAMSQLLFKKELRETLNKRRSLQETTEIEANQRQYVIRRMFVSGLMPEHRSVEIESIPDVVKCSLSPELVRGARVTKVKTTPIIYSSDLPSISSQVAFSNHYVPSLNVLPKRKSVGIQYDTEPTFKSYERYSPTASLTRSYHYQPTYSSAAQTSPYQPPTYSRSKGVTIKPVGQVDSETQTMVTSETQTEFAPEVVRPTIKPLMREVSMTEEPKLSSNANLLESTQKYFEEYDKRLREVPIHKTRYQFTDTTSPQEMEWKRQEVMKELERRKEKVASMIDLRYLGQDGRYNPPTAVMSDFSRPSRQYGSLPRSSALKQRLPQGYNYANMYGSLPRDFERAGIIQSEAYPPNDIPGLYSKSAQNLNNLPMRSSMMEQDMYNNYNNPYCTLPRQSRARPQFFDDSAAPMLSNDAMLSQYANYVNSQIDNAGFWNDPMDYANDLRQPMDTITRQAMDPSTRQQQYNSLTRQGIDPITRQPIMDPLRQQLLDPYYQPSVESYAYQQIPQEYAFSQQVYQPVPQYVQQQPYNDYVYSRREGNYGSRPLQSVGDYGNIHRPRIMKPRSDVINQNYMDMYDPMSSYMPMTPSYRQYSTLPSNTLSSLQDPYRPKYQPLNNNYNEPWPTTSLLRPYMTSSQPRSLQQPYTGYKSSKIPRFQISSKTRQAQRYEELLAKPDYGSGQRLSRSRNGIKIKRILLTRKYRHTNVYHDLGFRVTGGKRLANGELAAFITAVNRGKAVDTLGEIREGDQVLEWNGTLLRGKTFEEVERIINGTSGEIEVVVKSGSSKSGESDLENIYDTTTDDKRFYQSSLHREAPPVPAHRSNENRQRKQHYRQLDGCGKVQLAVGYDELNSVLVVTVNAARGLTCREYDNSIVLPNPFVKIYLLPGRKVVNKRRTKFVSNTAEPEWHQTVDYIVGYNELMSRYLEFTVWDYDKYNDNICLGQVTLQLANKNVLDNKPRWYPLQPADSLQPEISNVYTKQRSYLYNPSHLDLGYAAI